MRCSCARSCAGSQSVRPRSALSRCTQIKLQRWISPRPPTGNISPAIIYYARGPRDSVDSRADLLRGLRDPLEYYGYIKELAILWVEDLRQYYRNISIARQIKLRAGCERWIASGRVAGFAGNGNPGYEIAKFVYAKTFRRVLKFQLNRNDSGNK